MVAAFATYAAKVLKKPVACLQPAFILNSK